MFVRLTLELAHLGCDALQLGSARLEQLCCFCRAMKDHFQVSFTRPAPSLAFVAEESAHAPCSESCLFCAEPAGFCVATEAIVS